MVGGCRKSDSTTASVDQGKAGTANATLDSRTAVPERRSPIVREVNLGPLSDPRIYPTFDHDGEHLVYLTKRDSQYQVIVDGHAGETYEELAPARGVYIGSISTSVRSPNEATIVYDPAVETARHSGSEPITQFAFSRDGTRVAYVVRKTKGDNMGTLVVDGKEVFGENFGVNPFAGLVDPNNVVFSPDSKHFCCTVAEGSGVYVDGKQAADQKSGYYLGGMAQFPLFSPDSKHIAFIKAGGPLFVDGRRVPLDYEEFAAPVFSPDSSRLGFAARNGKEWRLIIDDVVTANVQLDPVYDKVSTPVFSPDGKKVAYIGESASGQCVVLNGKADTNFDMVMGNIEFSQDSSRIFYFAFRDQKWFLVEDGQASMVYEGADLKSPIVSAEGKRVAFAAKKGSKWMVVLDGHGGSEYDGIGRILFSSNGKHLAYISTNGPQQFVVLDAKQSVNHGDILESSLVFSADGEHLAYQAGDGDKRSVILDEWSLEYTALGHGPTFHTDGTLEFLGVKSNALYRVDVTPNGPTR